MTTTNAENTKPAESGTSTAAASDELLDIADAKLIKGIAARLRIESSPSIVIVAGNINVLRTVWQKIVPDHVLNEQCCKDVVIISRDTLYGEQS